MESSLSKHPLRIIITKNGKEVWICGKTTPIKNIIKNEFGALWNSSNKCWVTSISMLDNIMNRFAYPIKLLEYDQYGSGKTVDECIKHIKYEAPLKNSYVVCTRAAKNVFEFLTGIDIGPVYDGFGFIDSHNVDFLRRPSGAKSHKIYNIKLMESTERGPIEHHSFVIEIKQNKYRIFQSWIGKYSMEEWLKGWNDNDACRFGTMYITDKADFLTAYNMYGRLQFRDIYEKKNNFIDLLEQLLSEGNVEQKNNLCIQLFGVAPWKGSLLFKNLERDPNSNVSVYLKYVVGKYNCSM